MAEHDDWDIVSGAGITALAVAAMRAMESKRDDALINDPYAESFVRRSGTTVPMPTNWTDIDDSGWIAGSAGRGWIAGSAGRGWIAGSAGRGWIAGSAGRENQSEADKRWVNFWTVTSSYLGVRSRFFDEYFLDASTAGVRQVVILAAGLDTRAFRLFWPARVELFEIDQPKVLEFKDAVLRGQGALAGCARHIVPIDLRADWPEALLRANFDPERPTAWLAEGLLLYLPGAATEALFTHVHRLSAPSSWFATDEAGPDVRSRIHDPVHQEVRRRLGLDIAALWPDDDRPSPERWFRNHDWQVTAISRIQAADRYGRPLGESAGDIAKGTLLTARLT